MKVLALETSGLAGSVAALDDDRPLAELRLNPAQRSARSLAPAMRDLLGSVGWQPRDVRLVAVAVGPGSFTGLRVGVTTAKTFAFAVDAEVAGVNTLETIARQAPPASEPRLVAAIDAGRGQVFTASFHYGAGGTLEWNGEVAIRDVETWLAELNGQVRVTGPALEKLAGRLPPGAVQVPREFWYPSATTVGWLAFEQYAAGRRDDLWRLVPHYVRKSAAEEKWNARGAGKKG